MTVRSSNTLVEATVFLLWHVHELPNGAEDVKLLGVYSSSRRAHAARRRLGVQPGFSDTPDRFHVDRYQLNKDYWTDGFSTSRG